MHSRQEGWHDTLITIEYMDGRLFSKIARPQDTFVRSSGVEAGRVGKMEYGEVVTYDTVFILGKWMPFVDLHQSLEMMEYIG